MSDATRQHQLAVLSTGFLAVVAFALRNHPVEIWLLVFGFIGLNAAIAVFAAYYVGRK